MLYGIAIGGTERKNRRLAKVEERVGNKCHADRRAQYDMTYEDDG